MFPASTQSNIAISSVTTENDPAVPSPVLPLTPLNLITKFDYERIPSLTATFQLSHEAVELFCLSYAL
ncbi:hypothetical protein GCWU000342_01808 [Shuttleworthella satelles DSM 14600]|uniref:Uncharacterized protein n=1 Tax=Shuttleworthella satelles DSM 14600 TaxID=626523 RepID=C4GCW5_9FIRM|nr:hypothetical protein GCWU000342_01808 [Shuttleworthia satelles DSM 14600]